MRKLIIVAAAIATALLLAGCGHDYGYAGHVRAPHWAPHHYGPRPVVGAAIYGGHSWHGRQVAEPAVVQPDDCRGPDRVFSEEAGGCVVRITDRDTLERISPRVPIGHDPQCTGNAGYWTTVEGPQGPINVHRPCVYGH